MHNHLIPVLQEDHAVLQELVGQVQSTTGDFRQKQRLTNDLYLSVNGHMDIIEYTVLPVLRTFSGDSLPDMVAAQCDQLRGLLSDLLAHRTDSARLDASLKVLCETLNLQSKRECLFLLPALERALSAHDNAALASRAFDPSSRQGLFSTRATHTPSLA